MERPKEGGMKVYWWQGGLHAEPESPIETEALLVLLENLRYERPPEIDDPRTAGPITLGETQGDLEIDL
jgi:hypothetical protein